jgi:competence protein ComEA
MLRASNRILLGVVLLTVSSITMAQTAPHRKLASAIQLFLITVAPAETPQVVNVNTDDAPTLETNLRGVGPDQARAMVSYRGRHGEFKSLLDLLKVEGLDRQLIVWNKNLIEF